MKQNEDAGHVTGSTRYLWRQQQVSAAIRYVVDDQGEPMEVFDASAP
jgi:hypothetical protein